MELIPTMQLRFEKHFGLGRGVRIFLQQFWREVGEPRKATQDDVNAGNAAFVGSAVKMIGEWRDVPGLEIGLKQ